MENILANVTGINKIIDLSRMIHEANEFHLACLNIASILCITETEATRYFKDAILQSPFPWRVLYRKILVDANKI